MRTCFSPFIYKTLVLSFNQIFILLFIYQNSYRYSLHTPLIYTIYLRKLTNIRKAHF